MSGSGTIRYLRSQADSSDEGRRLGVTLWSRHFLTPTHPQWVRLTKECGIVSWQSPVEGAGVSPPVQLLQEIGAWKWGQGGHRIA